MQGGYNRTAHNAVYLWGGGLQHRPRVTCCRGWLGWGGGLQHVLSCLSGLVRVGGYNTDPVLRAVLSVGVGGYNTDRVLRAVLSVRVGWGGLQHRQCCYVPGWLGWGGGLQHGPRVTCRPVCRGWLGWGVTTLTVCYLPSCLSGGGGGYNTDRVLRAVLSVGGGVTTQTVSYVLSCLSAGVGWGYMPAILSVCIVKSETFSTTGFLMYQNNVSCERYISM